MRRVLLTFSLAFSMMLAACADRQNCCPCEEGTKLSPDLLSLLASAKAYHQKADLYLRQRQHEKAAQEIEQLLKLDLSSKWPEAEEVRLDAIARLAKMNLDAGKEGKALTLVDKGLESTSRESFYLANLFGLKGEILEARVKRLDAAGDKAEARVAAKEAMVSLEACIAMNKRLQLRLQTPKGGLR